MLEQGTLLHQAGDRKKEEAAMAKERKKQEKEDVSIFSVRFIFGIMSQWSYKSVLKIVIE